MGSKTHCGGEIWVVSKLNELAVRCGVSPATANVYLTEYWNDDADKERRVAEPIRDFGYSLTYVGGDLPEPQQTSLEKFLGLIGLYKEVDVRFPDLEAVEAAVDKALSLAPRARVR